VSIVDSKGSELNGAGITPLVERALRRRRLIGWRRWGMIVLYYRAGLTQGEIAEVFGCSRQRVSYEMKRAVEMAARELEIQRKYGGGDARR